MKIVSIALFMLIFNLVFGLVTSLPMYGGVDITVESNVTVVNASAIENINPAENMTLEQFYGYQFQAQVLTPLQILMNVLSSAFLCGHYLKSLIPIIPDSFANLLTTLVNTVYALGLIQFVSGRSMKTMK